MSTKRQGLKLIPCFIAVVLLLAGCGKTSDCGECFTPPEPLALRIIGPDGTTDLVYTGIYNPDTLALYFFNDGVRHDLDCLVQIDSIKQEAIVYSQNISWRSVEGQRLFHLYLTNSDTDSINLLVSRVTQNCCTYHSLEQLDIDGVPLFQEAGEHYYRYLK